MARNDPLRNFRYRVEIDSITQAAFSEVLIGQTTIDAVNYREGTDPPHVRTLSGLNKYENVTLKRGFVGANARDLYRWHQEVSAGQANAKRKKVTIVVTDEKGQNAARFVVSEAWPIKYEPTDPNAKGNEEFIELLELANEGIERVI